MLEAMNNFVHQNPVDFVLCTILGFNNVIEAIVDLFVSLGTCGMCDSRHRNQD